MPYRFINIVPQFFTNNGIAIVNGTLTFYEPGTLILKNTYPTQALGSANANPIVLNSVGSSPVEIWMDGEYRVILKNALGVVQWDRDPLTQAFLTDAQAVEHVAALQLLEGEFDGQSVNLLGYYAAGDAPSRMMRWDAASTDDDDGGRVFQVTGVPTGRWKSSIVDFMDLRLWGYKHDNTTDNYDALNRALNSALYVEPLAFNTRFAGTFYLADVGRGYCSQTLHLKNVHTLIGGGTHISDLQSCAIRWPADQGGVVFHGYNTDSTGTVAYGSSAGGSVWDGIGLDGGFEPGSVGTIGHGIWVRVRCILRNINVRGFAQNGVNNVAYCGAGGFSEGNTNNWFMENVRSQNNGGHGHYIDGSCANSGTAINCHGDYNGGYGIYESSFLGNTWIQPHTAVNTLGGYKADAFVPSVFINPYHESGQPASDFSPGALVLGSLHGADTALVTALGVHLTAAGGLLTNSRGYQSLGENSSGEVIDIVLGGDRNSQDILYFTHEVEAPLPWRLKFDGAGNLLFDYSNNTIPVFRISGPTTALTFGRAAAEPYAFQAWKFFTRSDNFGRNITHEGAAPTTGQWAQGDVVFNLGAAVGQPKGWQCTVSGSPGTWVSMGAL